MSIFKRTQRKYVKKAYRVRNWREYEAGLRNRGSLTVWISLTAGKLVNWDAPRPRRRKPGRQRKYSNHAIETAVTLGMPWCTTRDLGPQLSFTRGFEVPHEHFQTHSAEVCEEGLSREELA